MYLFSVFTTAAVVLVLRDIVLDFPLQIRGCYLTGAKSIVQQEANRDEMQLSPDWQTTAWVPHWTDRSYTQRVFSSQSWRRAEWLQYIQFDSNFQNGCCSSPVTAGYSLPWCILENCSQTAGIYASYFLYSIHRFSFWIDPKANNLNSFFMSLWNHFNKWICIYLFRKAPLLWLYINM